MRKFLLFLVVLLLVVAAGAAAAYWYAGRLPGPAIQIARPEKFVGTSTPLEVVVETPGAEIASLEVFFEQNGARTLLYSLGSTAGAAAVPTASPTAATDAGAATDAAAKSGPPASGQLATEPPDRLRLTREIGRGSVEGIRSGPARIVVTASRPVLFGLRDVAAETARDVEVRLERPKLAVLSTHHYVNQGGAEMVVYRVTPQDVTSGVAVGDVEYRGFPGTGVTADGVSITDPAVRVAFFALRYDQPLDTPIRLFARDEAGNVGRAEFDHRTFPKPTRKSEIELDDAFLDRVVPAILEGTTEVKSEGSTLDRFLAINGELRRKNNAKIASFAADSAPELLFRGEVFHPFTNTAVESAFADRRTYVYQGREVDQQVHLGFDLASFTGTPIVAAARGKVVYADELGIYGNCVILDHGMGVQSLYAHLSSIGVETGAMVEKEQEIGRSGMTGLAGGDHLHFTMLINGQMVNPVEWWDSHWMEDRILRKLRAAGASPPS